MIELILIQPTALSYMVLFIVAAAVYYLLPAKAGKAWLLVSCLVFIGISNIGYAAIAFIAAFFTWLCGKAIERADSNRTKKLLLGIHIIIILLMASAFRLFPEKTVLLPVGIMVYSLKAVSYTAGVYRKEISGDTDVLTCLVYILFFPVLFVGPLDSPQSLTKMIKEPHPFRFENLQRGFVLLLWGFILKLVVADNIAAFVDAAFEEDFNGINGSVTIAAMLLLTIQVYTTFYGFSVIAAGYSKILGFDIADNFNAPFLAPTMTDFRRGWNITLNSWAETNIFLPLTAGHSNKLYRAATLLLMTLFIGAWYGTETHYLAGAFLLGLYECLGHLLLPYTGKTGSGAAGIIKKAIRYAVVTVACLLFRSRRIKVALAAVNSIMMPLDWSALSEETLCEMGFRPAYWYVIIAGIAILTISDILKYKGIDAVKLILNRPYPVRLAIYTAAFAAIVIFGCWGSGYHQPHALCSFLY